jgi:hypothetical protein
MYSGDEFYGDEITSPTMRPNTLRPLAREDEHPATYPEFERWLKRLDAIIWNRVGCSLDDLEDFNTLDGVEDGLTPAQFYREYIAPEIGEDD